MEVGSIFEINPDTVESRAYGYPEIVAVDSERDYGIFLSSCREAIYCILEDNRNNVSNVCLMPAYMCDTVMHSFTIDGWKTIFYHVDRSLQSDPAKLEQVMEEEKPGILFLHNYYGVETTANLAGVVQKAKDLGIITVLDVTQSYYLTKRSYRPDYVIGSLRKWYPIPDGGFVTHSNLMIQPLQKDEYMTRECLSLRIDKYNYLQNKDADLKKNFMERHYEMEQYLDDKRVVTAMSDSAACILEETNEKVCEAVRRENAAYLFKAVSTMNTIEPITYTEGAAPLYFPIYAKDRDELKNKLVENDVYTPILWPIGEENKDVLSEDERYIYDHMLAIPIDQRYGIEAMEKIVTIMREFDNK